MVVSRIYTAIIVAFKLKFNFKVNTKSFIDLPYAEPDIPEPSLIEVELAMQKLKRHKATGVDHIPSELIQADGG